MAMEIPVVVTNVGGVPELVDNNINGIMVQPQDPESLAQGILRVIRNRNFALELSAAARKKIVVSFNSRLSAEMISREVRRDYQGK